MIIIYKKPGRLANCIWLYAHFIAFSIENNIPVCFPAFGDYGDHFKMTQSNLLYKYPPKKTVLKSNFFREIILKFIPLTIRICLKFKLKSTNYIFLKYDHLFNMEEKKNIPELTKKLVFIEGWLFRANSLILKHKEKVIEALIPLDKHCHNVTLLIDKCRTNSEILIGVHIRREDYRTAFNGAYYYEMEDYKRKMLEIKSLFNEKTISFLICSNEKIKKEDFEDLNIYLGNDHIIEDLYSLAKCNYIIGPPSTYSMWASFYGNVPLCQLIDIKKSILLEDFEIFTS